MPAPHTVYTISPSPDSTLAVEVTRSGLFKGKHLFVFESFRGNLVYDSEDPLASALELSIDAASLTCRDANLKAAKRERLTHLAHRLTDAPNQTHPQLLLRSERFVAKPLRGFVAEGILQFHGIEHRIKANIGFSTRKANRLQIDADATVHLSDFAISPPSAWLGLSRIANEVVLHALLWGTTG